LSGCPWLSAIARDCRRVVLVDIRASLSDTLDYTYLRLDVDIAIRPAQCDTLAPT
jgi:hypothetical protein